VGTPNGSGSADSRLNVLKLPEHETAFASGQLYGPSVLGNAGVITDSTRRIVAYPLCRSPRYWKGEYGEARVTVMVPHRLGSNRQNRPHQEIHKTQQERAD
jgi:hypothetical protein